MIPITVEFKSEYQAYHDARGRCLNEQHRQYKHYGQRGIKFKFNSFYDFITEIGKKPVGYCLDRINNEGHYESGNVRWVSYTTSNLNKRREQQARRHSNTKVQYVSWHKPKQKWCVQCTVAGKQRTLFYSSVFEEACAFAKGLVNV